jgi:MurNAc alpha-1-phosphate uridylyltransferase
MDIVDTIMIFAAGRGTRMHPLTVDTPKPLVKILGRPILYWVLDQVISYGFKNIVINTHYLGNQLEDAVNSYMQGRTNLPNIIISYEEELLETGGGLKNNLKYCSSELIFTINSDSFVISEENPFSNMLNSWNDNIMDIMMLVHPTDKTIGYSGRGDFFRKEDGSLYGIELEGQKPFMNAGVHLIRKSIVAEQPEKIFSLRNFYLDNHYNKRIFSVTNLGHWLHATSPKDIEVIESYLRENLPKKV